MRDKKLNIKSKIKVLDLFCGIGGLSYGFLKDRNFKIIAANEINPKMAKTYLANHKNVKMYCQDISSFGIKVLRSQEGVKDRDNQIDLVIGGPPCQAYSTAGKRLLEDPRASLFKEYHRVLKELKPKMFIYENVKGLLSINGGKLFEEITSIFKSLGYKLEHKVLNAADFGTPQIRERVIIVGLSAKASSKDFPWPKPTHGISDAKPHLSLKDALSDLPTAKIVKGGQGLRYKSNPQNAYQEKMRCKQNLLVTSHSPSSHSKRLVKIMSLIPEGGGPKDLPKRLKPKSGFANSYSRLWWDKPSTTITRNLGTPSSARCIHPLENRGLTTREGARLQGFPDNYILLGNKSEQNLQLGNAVPTQLSIALTKSCLKYFQKLGV